MEEMERNIRGLSDKELIEMVNVDFEEYTDEALAIARDEMRKRGICEQGEESEPDDAAIGAFGLTESVESIMREELQYAESFNAILDFVASMNIRCGEYEGVNAVIKKMDRENFILYCEAVKKESGRVINGCLAIGRDELVELIERIAKENGFVEEEVPEEDY